MKLNAYWKITSMGTGKNRKEIDTGSIAEKNFDVKAQMEGDKLFLSLIGRIDSLTAPGILSFYEKTVNENDIKEVYVNCEELQYISSAGLRVLLIMKKNTQGGIFLNNVNTEVMEILKTTGFDSVFLEHTDDN